ncbi:hypothetical protein IC235_00645 [Hymenobacter sp. BT664]|uniref:Uncharacterized protein n=1 Tax=Hymenobacter montanus TaxID=2771359 RepID=A0A927B9U8_9BACT|nr:hypothetical protein [Hymenobacter montanus]MBD2766395.1 hypothetical protein [Hymenobacter montanus]
MQLEDLRQGWLNPPEPPAPISSAQLEKLLVDRPGLVSKMRRNARWEMTLTVLILMVGIPVRWPILTNSLYKLYIVACLLPVMAGLCFYFYYRLLTVLNRMLLVEGNVRGHLQQLAAGLRALLRFYYRLSLATFPVTMVLNLGYVVAQELARSAPLRWERILSKAGILLGVGILVQVLLVYGMRWYIQRLYGQHLDRLEANLAELEEPVD